MKIAKKIVFGIFIALAILYIFIVVSPKIFPGFYPFGIKTAIVLTGSMSPEIEINDFVVIKQPGEIAVGDIVAYKDDSVSEEVLHRVIKIDGDEVITKGDANNTNDKPISKAQITGVYVGKIEHLGEIISFINQPVVFSIIVTLLVVIMFIPSRNSIRNNKKRGDRNEIK